MKNKQGLKQGCGAGAGLFCWSRSQPFLLEPEPAFLLEPEPAFFAEAGASLFCWSRSQLFCWSRSRPFFLEPEPPQMPRLRNPALKGLLHKICLSFENGLYQ